MLPLTLISINFRACRHFAREASKRVRSQVNGISKTVRLIEVNMSKFEQKQENMFRFGGDTEMLLMSKFVSTFRTKTLFVCSRQLCAIDPIDDRLSIDVTLDDL